ncbi:hypothetical protein [Fodinicola feengrottensis]
MTREEQEWFPKVREAMGRNEVQAIGQRMLDAKPNAPRDPLKLASATV